MLKNIKEKGVRYRYHIVYSMNFSEQRRTFLDFNREIKTSADICAIEISMRVSDYDRVQIFDWKLLEVVDDENPRYDLKSLLD